MIRKLIFIIPLTLLLGDHLGFIPQWNITTMKKTLSNKNVSKEYIYLSENLQSEHFYDEYGNIEKSIYGGDHIINYINIYDNDLLIKRKDDYMIDEVEYEYDEDEKLIKITKPGFNRFYDLSFIYEFKYDTYDNLEELYIIESGKHKGYLPDYYDTTRTIKYINDYDEYNRLSEVRFNSNGNTCKMIYEYLGEEYLNDYGVKYFTNDTLLHQIQYDLNDKIVVDYIVVDGEVIGGLRHFYE